MVKYGYRRIDSEAFGEVWDDIGCHCEHLSVTDAYECADAFRNYDKPRMRIWEYFIVAMDDKGTRFLNDDEHSKLERLWLAKPELTRV